MILPTATLTSANNLNCTNTSSILTAGGGTSYNFGSGFSATNTSTISTPNTYTVTVTVANGCTDTESVSVTQNIVLPTASIAPTAKNNCTAPYNGVLTLTSDGSTFAWSNSRNHPKPRSYECGYLYRDGDGANGCTATSSGTMHATPQPFQRHLLPQQRTTIVLHPTMEVLTLTSCHPIHPNNRQHQLRCTLQW